MFHAEIDTQNLNYTNPNQFESFETSDEEVYYGNNNRGFQSKKKAFFRQRSGENNPNIYNYSAKKYGGNNTRFNPTDEFGNTLTCKYCHSLCHMVAVCPDCPEHIKRRYQSRNSFATKSNNSAYL